jgi:hypothetical protein
VKQLAGPQRLADRVVERQARHRLVRELGVHADHLRVGEALDEVQHRPGRREIDVGARLVGLGLERDPRVESL